ncbi:DUF4276 family protein [Solidesulfovibrio sp.]|uniref:DUF4276 family protein n=1 Tax=Solidesulfovibrio sp. TaxID=2910990 RepID=UPI002614B4F1|nr:DUF4276 family protein [Solidesulfovibrio sp.]
MKIILLVEGETEQKALPEFFRRWLQGRHVDPLPAISAVNAEGCGNHIKECARRTELHLKNPDVVAVFGLLDVYGANNIPGHCRTVDEKCDYLRQLLEREVGSPKFRQHFAVHELEAWLLSDPTIFPPAVRKGLPAKAARPETVNSTEPPSKLLERLYRKATKREYKKRVDGHTLFTRLDPNLAYAKCKALAALLDDMLACVRDARA